MKCYEPKFPLKLSEAAKMIHDAGGILALAHGNDPSGTSLVKYTTDLNEHAKIIEQNFLEYIDGIECWHSRHDEKTTEFYLEFAKNHKLIMTGGTDCHQKPVRMGSVQIPGFVVEQFY
jgi:predicted metal-dependent phosphoesterase TrpH